MRRSPRSLLVFLPLVFAAVGSCFAEPGPVPAARDGSGGKGASAGRGGEAAGLNLGGTGLIGAGGEAGASGPVCPPPRPLDERARCRTVDSSEPLLGRIPVPEATDVSVFTSELFAMMKTSCGTCHVPPAGLGDPPFQIRLETMPEVVTRDVYDIITSDDPDVFMPPSDANGRPFSSRSDGDSVRKLAVWLDAWLNQGSPPDVFVLPADLGGQSPYLYDESFAEKLSNIGSCVADVGLVATEADRSCALDERFATLEKSTATDATDVEWVGLPSTLDQTDLVTLDSEELAKLGVISFAPGYPLWSDGAGKMRHVRVPRGQSIHFDRQTQEFEIPPNTRFYKTFLKKIIDKDGSERMKKMETRLIVSRPDRIRDDGTHEITALFGTYVWNEQETRADLLTDGQLDQKPFADRVVKYVTDEPGAKQVLDDLREGRDRDLALTDARVVRHYAIPGRQRCVQCHMGSHGENFVLGFTPMQILRRPAGEGGVIEPSGPDELTQLERLIDYGVITGIDSVDDVVLLEDSQGNRHARTEQELTAQGYLFGNCAHCHNPNGFASVSAPELRDKLDFWPRPDGGIFEFPLDRMSPRLKRGKQADFEMPYITPSLRDAWPATPDAPYTPKLSVNVNDDGTPKFLDAPWRSLIYRNVDTPFIYTDDYAIFPHMPRNTAGYDCRAPRILADWMVSIPAKRVKNPQLFNEDGIPGISSSVDNTPQPYSEVRPDDPEYGDALVAASRRLEAYHAGERYSYCVDQTDIVDRNVIGPGATGKYITPSDDELIGPNGAPHDGVPDRVHWVFLDETEPPGLWFPRRPDWEPIIVDQHIPPVPTPTVSTDVAGWARKIQRDAEVELVGLLQDVTLDGIRDFALSPFPLGLWQAKAGCDFSSVRKLRDLETPRPRWAPRIDPVDAGADAGANVGDTPVYDVLPGEAVFNMVCINCHGPRADSRGPIASTLAEVTGGLSRVANFRAGLFGEGPDGVLNRDRECPESQPHCSFRAVVEDGNLDISSQDLAARYLPWMALGGTKAPIPSYILNAVANTEVLGRKRTGAVGGSNSANMLSVAKDLCEGILARPAVGGSKVFFIFPDTGAINWAAIYSNSGLILENGDTELWETLCNLNNPSPIRVLNAFLNNGVVQEMSVQDLYRRTAYPPGARIGNQDGHIETTTTQPASMPGAGNVPVSNRFPWCLREPAPGTPAHDQVEAYLAQHTIDGEKWPYCPAALLADANHLQRQTSVGPSYRDDARPWIVRGGINTGLAVFLYLEEFIVNGRTPTPPYDRCEELAQ